MTALRSPLLLVLLLATCASATVQIYNCFGAMQNVQAWDLSAGTLALKGQNQCISAPNTTDQAPLQMSPCQAGSSAEGFKFNPTSGTIVHTASGKCLDRHDYGVTPGTEVYIYHCTGAKNQEWKLAANNTIVASDSGLCLSSTVSPRPCDHAEAGAVYCNPNADHNDRAKDIISRLSTSDKVGLLMNTASAVANDKIVLPAYQWWSEALHGVGHSPGVSFSAPTPFATSFPQVIATSATLNRTLWNQIGTAISSEARAFNNVGHAGLTFWTPNINIIRDPRWGRGQETPGEDPYLTGQYAGSFVRGLQDGEDPNHIKASSCCKHYFDYNLESWHGTTRHNFNAVSPLEDIADTYLPAFESCVREGHVSGLMCSYNAVNGIPSCANYDAMTTIARESWGFQGYITSDCGAVNDVYDQHHYTPTPSKTCSAVLSAGMDTECGSFFKSNLPNAISDGSVTESMLDNALTNLFVVQIRLGLFDPVSTQPYLQYNYTDKVNTPAHQQLALEAAQQSLVLLKNSNNALPLKKGINVALIGPNANVTGTMQGNYQGTAPFLITPVDGARTYTNQVTYSQGCNSVGCDKTTGFADAVAAAKAADVVIAIIGLDQTQESEGHDRELISLPGNQDLLVSQVAAAAKVPIIVVVMTGGAVDVSAIRDNAKVGAIVWSGYPGQAGGQAIADVLWGTYNPGGRLPYTVYPASFVDETSMFDCGMRPNKTSGNPGRTYRFYTGTPVFEFGTGLSYTTFTYTTSNKSSLSGSLQQVDAYLQSQGRTRHTSFGAPTFDRLDITVTNTGAVAGSDVVLAFIVPPRIPGSETLPPIKSLIGFERVFLLPGQSVTLEFPVTPTDVSVVKKDGTRVSAQGEWMLEIGSPRQLAVPVLIK